MVLVRLLFLLLGLFTATGVVLAAENAEKPAFRLQAPLVDEPFNFSNDYAFPSMQQSLGITAGFYDATHYGIARLVEDHLGLEPIDVMGGRFNTALFVRNFAIASFDVLSLYMPLGATWLHEEWHRAAMSRRGISSYDEVYSFPFFKDSISVSHVSDEALIKLKTEHPAEQTRLAEAGLESALVLNSTLEREQFFDDASPWHGSIIFINHITNLAYLFECASSDADRMTDKFNQEDGASISARDFTGLDCTGWAYDLDRPNEPYSARGVHPSGVGINRYRRYSDLSSEEQNYLHKQSRLSLLNLLDPGIFDIRRFKTPDFDWNFALRYYLTSFGSSFDVNFLFRNRAWKVFATTHNYFNHEAAFPGFEFELLEFPGSQLGGDRGVRLQTKAMAWLQPAGQEFRSASAKPGGLLAVRAIRPIYKTLEAYAEIEAKTEGWVAGNVYLNSAVSGRLGLALSVGN